MLIQALCQYYEKLQEKGLTVPEGYSKDSMSFLIELTPEGRLAGIIDWRDQETIAVKGKPKEVFKPKKVILPKREDTTKIESYILEHRALYIFGLHYDKKQGTFYVGNAKDKAAKSHQAFVDTNLTFIEGIQSPIAQAYARFIKQWKPEEETQNPLLLGQAKEYETAHYGFCLEGRPDILLHEDPQVKAKWEQWYTQKNEAEENAVEAQCAVMGEKTVIARLHKKIKGLPNPGTGGNSLVCFNNDAESSYGLEQSYNSNISEKVMQQYTEALNYLLASPEHKQIFNDDIAVVHWAASAEEACDDLFNAFVFSDSNRLDETQTEVFIQSALMRAKQGKITADTLQLPEKMDPKVDFYIVGLKTNASRIAVKFLYRRTFGEVFQNMLQHQVDLSWGQNRRPISIKAIKQELISPKSEKDTLSPALATDLMEAILLNRPYPQQLLYQVIQRIKIDQDEEKKPYLKINALRTGIIKACIHRQARYLGKKEEFTMNLNLENTHPAYLCGRLFAVLENLQRKASGYDLNRTIRDSYFASAVSRPAGVFPKLIILAQYHLSKLDNPKYEDERIRGIVDMLQDHFPTTLSIEDQGTFIIGYYQQKEEDIAQAKKYKEEKQNGHQE